MIRQFSAAALLVAFSEVASACVPSTHNAAYSPPFLRPVADEIVETFGMRYHPLLNTRKHHNGIDFGSEIGRPLMAAASGEVIRAGNQGAFGIAILIGHQDGWETYYAHLTHVVVRIGDCVRRGDVIGYTGNTGFTVGKILHFEVRRNETPIDPMNVLTRTAPQ